MFLANENFPRPSILALRLQGFAVKSIQEEFPGISDERVILLALEHDLIILTFDRDYGELIFKYGKNKFPSVIFFREKGQGPLYAGKVLLELLFNNSKVELKNAFTVIESKNIRQRFY